jgi:hypothetical protein
MLKGKRPTCYGPVDYRQLVLEEGGHASVPPTLSDADVQSVVGVLRELKLVASQATGALRSCTGHDSESASLAEALEHMEGASRDATDGSLLVATASAHGTLVIHVPNKEPVAVDALCTSLIVD